jgi:hypothetical protein
MSSYPRPITLTPQMKALRGATAISGIGLFGKHHGKALAQVAERNQLRLQAEAVEQALQILVLNRPLQGGDTQVAQVKHTLQVQLFVAVQLRPTE